MRARSLGLWLGAVLVFASLAGPGAAIGKSDYFVEPAGLNMSFSLPAGHGYRVTIVNLGGEKVFLSAAKRGVSANYLVPGSISADRIKANFGRLGHIDVAFDDDPRLTKLKKEPRELECKGRASIQEVGVFRGQIAFNGEQEFTTLSTRQAKGTVLRSFRRVCKWPPWLTPGPGDKGKKKPKDGAISLTTLAAAARSRAHTTSFEFSNIELIPGPGDEGLTYGAASAVLDERRGRIQIRRTAFSDGNEGSLLVSAPGLTPATATVSLPEPFSGSASYSAAPGSKPTWTGSLAVSLPGVGQIPLTGPDFAATLCRGEGLELAPRCARRGEGRTAVVVSEPRHSGGLAR